MVVLIQRWAHQWGAVLVVFSGLATGGGLALADQSYEFRGVRAPQVRSTQMSADLLQKLTALQVDLRKRSQRASLSDALEQSLLKNPELAQAYGQIQQSQWSLIAIRRQWYPAVTASGGGPSSSVFGYRGSGTYFSRSDAYGTDEQQTFRDNSSLVTTLNLSWTFFDPSRASAINAASESLLSQQLLFNVAARNLVLRTQLAYFTLQEQVTLIDSYERILIATNSQVSQVEALFNTGYASIAEVEQIRTQQFQTLTLLINTYRGVIDAAASLAQAMALAPGRLALPADQLDRFGRWDLQLSATIQQALSMREEIQSSIAQSNSANWIASSLFNRYWPRFGLAASASYTNTNDRSREFNFNNKPANDIRTSTSGWDAGLGMFFTWSIFDGGISAADAQAQKAVAQQQLDLAALQRLQVSAEVERSYASYEASLLALQSSAEQLRSAEQAAVAVRARYKVGYDNATSVVQTLNQTITAANVKARSISEYNSAVASLYRASARWPDSALSLRDQRVQSLKRR